MIIVMPNGEDGLHGYNPDTYNYSYERQIIEELIPHIEDYFCTWNQSSSRSIGGLSRGGFWAYEIAFRHPELFDRVGGHSPAFFDDGNPEYNPYFLVDTAVGIERLKMYLDHGASDWTVDNVRYFVEHLRRRTIEPEYIVNPVGQHVEDYWASHTADYLAFYSADWPKDVRELPSCHHPSPVGGDDE
jgi:enterochelin esterase-like enzyme